MQHSGFTLRTYTPLMPSSEARTSKAIDRMLRNGRGAADGLPTACEGPDLPKQVRAQDAQMS